MTRDGTPETIDAEWMEDFNYPALSPDGLRLAVSVGGDETHLWIKQLGGGQQKLTFEGAVNWRPAWTPDGEAVAFVSNRGGGGSDTVNGDLYMRRADGSATTELVLDLEEAIWEVDYSQDGQWLLYRTGPHDLYAKQFVSDAVPIPLLVSEHLERQLALSPDGQWLAYISDETGRFEVYVVPFPDVDTQWLVSRSGGTEPRWAHSGRELFFKSAGMLMSVDVQPGSTFTAGEPQPLFSVQGYREAANRQQYDVASDDRRFVMIRDTATDPGQLVYVENFFEELKAKVGR